MINYEDRILTILLQKPEVFKGTAAFLKKDALSQAALKYVYSKMLGLLDASKKRSPAPLEVLKSAIMEERPEDGANYVELVNRLSTQDLSDGEHNLLEHYVDQVHRAHKELEFKDTLLSIADAISKRDVTRAEAILQKAAAKHSPRSASVFRGDLFADAASEVAFSNLIKTDPNLYSPLRTGLQEIDDRVGGLFKTEVGLVQAPPGGGKSTFLMQVAVQAMMDGKKVALVTLEMSKRQYWWRFASRLTEIPYRKFKFGELEPEESAEVRDFFKGMHDNGARLELIHFTRGASAKDIEAALLDLPYEVDLLVIDYLNRMQPSQQFSADMNWLATGVAMEELCQLAASIYLGKGLACWTGQQLQGGKEGQRNQTTSDAAFSKIPGHHAHAVAYITKTKDGYYCGAAKWRDGRVDEFPIYPEFAKFMINQPRPSGPTPAAPPVAKPAPAAPVQVSVAGQPLQSTASATSDADF